MKPWHTMFREADGSVSATRVALLLTVLNVNVMWDVSCFMGKPLSMIPPSVCVFVATLAGLKWGQMPHESDGPAQGNS